METAAHPELQEKLQELEHELEVSHCVSKAEKSLEFCLLCWRICAMTHVEFCRLASTYDFLLMIVTKRKEISQKKGTHSFVLGQGGLYTASSPDT